MLRVVLALLLCLPAAASVIAQTAGEPLDMALRNAEHEQAAAEAEAAKLGQIAAQASNQAARLHAQQEAAAQSIQAAEARITAADVRLRLTSAYVAAHRQQLAAEQQPATLLLAGLASMARRPPLLVLAGRGGTDELVEVRLLLDSTLPVIRRRTSRLSAELGEGQRLQQAALDARTELVQSRQALLVNRQRYAALEAQAVRQSLATGGRALGAGDFAMAAQENLEKLRGQQTGTQSIRGVAAQLAEQESPPLSPFASEGGAAPMPFAYALPVVAPVADGLAAVDDSGVRSRGLKLATPRAAPVTAPANGVVRFSAPFRNFDGILLIDHGSGWFSLIVNVASPLRSGDRVTLGDDIGRALGPIEVELSHNGQWISPALIAGSSQSLSKSEKGG